MVEYSKVNIKLADTQLKKIENTCQRKNRNNSENEFKNVWWKWFTAWIVADNKQKTKLRNAFNNNMSPDFKLSRAQISKMIQSGGFLGSLLNKLAGPLIKIAFLWQKMFYFH